MKVAVRMMETSQPCEFTNVISAYAKGTLRCIQIFKVGE